ncbi:retrovirus-related pol polyprotein from transposon TNT 1-94 [Tanacetum coccineum]
MKTLKPEIKVYSRRPKQIKSVDIPSSSSLVNDRFLRSSSGIWTLDVQNKMTRTALSSLTSLVYYIEGPRHNLFSVGKFCDADLEVAFWKNTCFTQNLEGVDLLSGSQDTNLYTISLDDMLKTSPICLLSKASKTKSWLWHRCLSYLNFSTLNKLAKDGLAQGIPKLKFQKDHLCSACALGKSNKSSFQPKDEDTNQEKPNHFAYGLTLWPDRLEALTGKKYILDSLFQPLFDEYFNPPTIVVSTVPVAAAPRAVEIADSPVSTSIDQDAPSSSHLYLGSKCSYATRICRSPNGFKTAFLNASSRRGLLELSHARARVTGFVEMGQEYPSHVYKIKKALYGLKQAPHAWYDIVSSFLISQHFSKDAVDPTLFTRKAGNDLLLVPFTKRVKISSTNVRLETIVPQKEETFQVVIDLVKNSSCFKAFTISADVLEIFIQQFWYSIKKGVNFTNVPDDDTTPVFLIKLGYKGPLYKHTNMFVDHMHHPWRTLAAIINKCLSRKTSSNDKLQLIWEDLAYQIDHRKEKRSRRENMPFPRLKFVRIGKNYQEYRLSIPETMLTEAIKQSESYQMFIKYSISQIPPKSRGKGLQRKNTAEDSQETVDVSKESEPKPESVKRKTSSKRRVKKKVALSADDNIIFDDPDTALELGKSISQTEAEEAEVARQSYKTLTTSNTKLKGAPSLTPEEQEAADIMQALKESKKTSKRQPGVPNEEKDITEENVILEWGSEQESEYSEEDKLGDEEKDDKNDDANDEGHDYYKIYVPNDEDEEMLNAKVDDSDKGDEEVTDAAKADTEKTSEVKDDAKKTKLPPSNCSLSVSSGFGDKFLKLSSDSSLLRVAKLEKDMSELKKIDLSVEALAYLKTQIPSVIDNYLGSKVGDVFKKELKKHTTNLIQKYSLQQIPELPKKQTPTVDLEQESKKTPLEILMIKKEQTEKQKMPKFTINSTNKAALKEFDLKSSLYPTKHANKSFNGNPTNHRLYHALMEALIEDENAMDK